MYNREPSRKAYRDFIRAQGPFSGNKRDPASAALPDDGDTPEASRPKRSAWYYLRRFLREFHDLRWKLTLVLTLSAVSILVEAAFPWAGKFMIDSILPRKDVNLLFAACLGLLGVGLVRVAFSGFSDYLVMAAGGNVAIAIQRKMMHHLQRMPLARIQQLKVGGIISRLQQDIENLSMLLSGALMRPFNAAIMFTVALVSMLTISGKVTLVCIVCSLLMMLVAYAFFNVMRPFRKMLREDNSTIAAGLSEVFSGIQVVRSCGREATVKRDFALNTNLLWRKNLYATGLGMLVERSFWMIFFLWEAAVWLCGGYHVIHGTMTAGEVVVFITFADWMFRPIFMIMDSLSSLQTALACAERTFDLLDEPVDVAEAKHGRRVDAIRDGFEFRNVVFDYSGGVRALDGVTIRIPKGKMTALVGPSGSGKTTLTNLVLRFYEVTSGELLLDGVNIKELRLRDYRRLMSLVLQDVYLFDGTVRENILFGKTTATSEEVEQAARVAHCHEFIATMEKQYDTVIGERGVRLSGGQKQRIALARALIANPQLLILDEATSNLDSESESLIQDALKKIFASRTSLVIAHRLSTIMDADNIIVIDGGRVVEQGTQTALLQLRGKYYEMYTRQMEKAEMARNYWVIGNDAETVEAEAPSAR